jgi:hypothetical protein
VPADSETPRQARARLRREQAFPARFAGLQGGLLGLVLLVPAAALAVHALARIGIGDRFVGLGRALRMAVLFASLPALLSGIGLGRVAARAAIAPGAPPRGRRRGIAAAARTGVFAGIGLVVVTAIPLGRLPDEPLRWLWYAAAGGVAGALCGAAIGAVCGRSPEGLGGGLGGGLGSPAPAAPAVPPGTAAPAPPTTSA